MIYEKRGQNFALDFRVQSQMFRKQRCWTLFFGLLENYRVRCSGNAEISIPTDIANEAE